MLEIWIHLEALNGNFNINNFYYLSDYETNKDGRSDFTKIEMNVITSKEFIDNCLNKNVKEYNLKNKDNIDFVQLKMWNMNSKTGVSVKF